MATRKAKASKHNTSKKKSVYYPKKQKTKPTSQYMIHREIFEDLTRSTDEDMYPCYDACKYACSLGAEHMPPNIEKYESILRTRFTGQANQMSKQISSEDMALHIGKWDYECMAVADALHTVVSMALTSVPLADPRERTKVCVNVNKRKVFWRRLESHLMKTYASAVHREYTLKRKLQLVDIKFVEERNLLVIRTTLRGIVRKIEDIEKHEKKMRQKQQRKRNIAIKDFTLSMLRKIQSVDISRVFTPRLDNNAYHYSIDLKTWKELCADYKNNINFKYRIWRSLVQGFKIPRSNLHVLCNWCDYLLIESKKFASHGWHKLVDSIKFSSSYDFELDPGKPAGPQLVQRLMQIKKEALTSLQGNKVLRQNVKIKINGETQDPPSWSAGFLVSTRTETKLQVRY